MYLYRNTCHSISHSPCKLSIFTNASSFFVFALRFNRSLMWMMHESYPLCSCPKQMLILATSSWLYPGGHFQNCSATILQSDFQHSVVTGVQVELVSFVQVQLVPKGTFLVPNKSKTHLPGSTLKGTCAFLTWTALAWLRTPPGYLKQWKRSFLK